MNKLENSQSNLNFFRSLTPQERSALNNSRLSDLSSSSVASSHNLIRSLDTKEMQRLDYVRDTPYSNAQREDCVRTCMQNWPNHLNQHTPEYIQSVCIQKCSRTRSDYI